MGFGFRGLGFGYWGLRCGVFVVEGVRVEGLGFRVERMFRDEGLGIGD